MVSRELARGGLDDRESLGRFAFGKQDGLDLPAPFLEFPDDAAADGLPGAGFRHDDRATGLEPAQRCVHGRGRDPITEHDPADRRRRWEQPSPRLGAGGPALEMVFDSVYDTSA